MKPKNSVNVTAVNVAAKLTRSIIMLHILFRGNLAKNGLLTQISHQKLR